LFVACVAAVSAASAAEIGRSRVVSSAAVRVDYDSNIFLNASEVSDTILNLNIGSRLVHDASVVTTEVGVTAQGLIFADHNDENTFDPGIDGRIGYVPSDKTSFTAAASYRRSSQAVESLNDRAVSHDLSLNSVFEHLTTEKFGLRIRGSYLGQDFRTRGYSDVYNARYGADAIYVYSPKLKTFVGAAWGDSWTKNRAPGRRNPGGSEARYTVGFEGEVSPKITGDLRLGVVQRDFSVAGRGDESALFLESALRWAAAEKTLWTLNLGQDLGVSAADQASKNFSSSLVLTQALAEKINLEASVGYSRANYNAFGGAGTRTDKSTSYRLRLNYTLTEDVTADASIGYRNNDSTLTVSRYDQLNLGAGITVRF
jgi:hypothetical protein